MVIQSIGNSQNLFGLYKFNYKVSPLNITLIQINRFDTMYYFIILVILRNKKCLHGAYSRIKKREKFVELQNEE